MPAIDRGEYDIPKTIIDQEDIHLASLKHKFTRTRVRVKRDFKGAKILALEKKTERHIAGATDREPEILSPVSESYTPYSHYKPPRPQRGLKPIDV